MITHIKVLKEQYDCGVRYYFTRNIEWVEKIHHEN